MRFCDFIVSHYTSGAVSTASGKLDTPSARHHGPKKKMKSRVRFTSSSAGGPPIW